MLNSLLASQPGDAQPEHIYFVHGARDANDHPFAEQLMAVAAAHPHVSVHLRDSRPSEVTREDGVRSVGRVDIEFLKRVLPFGDYDFYLCGPGAFMQDLYNGLRALNIADDRIRFEAFGPASVKRDPERCGCSSCGGCYDCSGRRAARVGSRPRAGVESRIHADGARCDVVEGSGNATRLRRSEWRAGAIQLQIRRMRDLFDTRTVRRGQLPHPDRRRSRAGACADLLSDSRENGNRRSVHRGAGPVMPNPAMLNSGGDVLRR